MFNYNYFEIYTRDGFPAPPAIRDFHGPYRALEGAIWYRDIPTHRGIPGFTEAAHHPEDLRDFHQSRYSDIFVRCFGKVPDVD